MAIWVGFFGSVFVSFDVSDMNTSDHSPIQEETVSSESQYTDVVADESGRKSNIWPIKTNQAAFQTTEFILVDLARSLNGVDSPGHHHHQQQQQPQNGHVQHFEVIQNHMIVFREFITPGVIVFRPINLSIKSRLHTRCNEVIYIN